MDLFPALVTQSYVRRRSFCTSNIQSQIEECLPSIDYSLVHNGFRPPELVIGHEVVHENSKLREREEPTAHHVVSSVVEVEEEAHLLAGEGYPNHPIHSHHTRIEEVESGSN